jgi:hypothetical protein
LHISNGLVEVYNFVPIQPRIDIADRPALCVSDGLGRCKMRILGFLVFCAAALWVAYLMFYKGRYSNQVWLELNQQAQKANYEVRRWVRF